MSERDSLLTITNWLEKTVNALQTGVAFVLVVVLVIGLVNLVATFGQSVIGMNILEYENAVGLISTTIEIVLYLFILIELFRTTVAYVEAKNVVKTVIHAGLIAVVRQILIFKPGDADTPSGALMTAGAYVILLVVLLLGFYLVHREADGE